MKTVLAVILILVFLTGCSDTVNTQPQQTSVYTADTTTTTTTEKATITTISTEQPIETKESELSNEEKAQFIQSEWELLKDYTFEWRSKKEVINDIETFYKEYEKLKENSDIKELYIAWSNIIFNVQFFILHNDYTVAKRYYHLLTSEGNDISESRILDLTYDVLYYRSTVRENFEDMKANGNLLVDNYFNETATLEETALSLKSYVDNIKAIVDSLDASN